MSDATSLRSVIGDTTDELFEVAGGFAFTDELALKLNAKWRTKRTGPVVVSAVDLAWLLDGYARSRLSALVVDQWVVTYKVDGVATDEPGHEGSDVLPTGGAANHVHACLTCAPDAATPGPGCGNCRQTGYDQTPCVGCRTGGAEP